MARTLHAAGAAVLIENMPVAILEAFAYGKPVMIATRVGGVPDVDHTKRQMASWSRRVMRQASPKRCRRRMQDVAICAAWGCVPARRLNCFTPHNGWLPRWTRDTRNACRARAAGEGCDTMLKRLPWLINRLRCMSPAEVTYRTRNAMRTRWLARWHARPVAAPLPETAR